MRGAGTFLVPAALRRRSSHSEFYQLRPVLDLQAGMERQFKVVVEKHPDGYVAYPLGLKRTVVGRRHPR
jgi:hypothetical protein